MSDDDVSEADIMEIFSDDFFTEESLRHVRADIVGNDRMTSSIAKLSTGYEDIDASIVQRMKMDLVLNRLDEGLRGYNTPRDLKTQCFYNLPTRDLEYVNSLVSDGTISIGNVNNY